MRQSVYIVAVLLLSIFVAQAQGERLQVVASHSILGDVVAIIAGDAADVTMTMPRGTDPHSFQPVPGDLVAMANADVIFINGMFFEEGLLESIENAGDDMNIVTASACVEILAFGAHDEDADEHSDEHEADADQDEMSAIATLCKQHNAEITAFHGQDYHNEVETLGMLYTLDCGGDHAEDGDEQDGEHTEGSCDPHVWMDPHNVMYWAMLIRDTVIELDPANAEVYAANTAAYLVELEALKHDFIMPLVETLPTEKRILVTSHDSLGYFAAHNAFKIVSTIIPGGSTLAEPSTADIVNVIETIRAENVPAIFTETTVNPNLAQQIASETGATVYVLYSGSLSDTDEPASTYLDYMRYNVTTIVEALSNDM